MPEFVKRGKHEALETRVSEAIQLFVSQPRDYCDLMTITREILDATTSHFEKLLDLNLEDERAKMQEVL